MQCNFSPYHDVRNATSFMVLEPNSIAMIILNRRSKSLQGYVFSPSFKHSPKDPIFSKTTQNFAK